MVNFQCCRLLASEFRGERLCDRVSLIIVKLGIWIVEGSYILHGMSQCAEDLGNDDKSVFRFSMIDFLI